MREACIYHFLQNKTTSAVHFVDEKICPLPLANFMRTIKDDGHFSNFDKTLKKLYFRKLLYSRNLFHKLLWLKSLVIETKLMLS